MADAPIPGMKAPAAGQTAPTMQDVYQAMGLFNQLLQSQQSLQRPGYPTVVGGGGAGSALGKVLVPPSRAPVAPAPLGQYLTPRGR